MDKSKYKIIDVIKPKACGECPHLYIDSMCHITCQKYDKPTELFVSRKPSFCKVEEVLIVNE